MALADIPSPGQSRRLDSWKEIAEYLGRDVRTATRWEAQGMPLHRVPGGKGSSVFAFTNEIDAWLRGNDPDRDVAAGAVAAESAPELPQPFAWRRHLPLISGILCATGVLIAVAFFALRDRAPARDTATLRVLATPTDVSVTDESGGARVIYRFAPGRAAPISGASARVADLNADGEAEILVAVSFYADQATRGVRHGELLNLSAAGAVRWRFGFNDVLTFGDRTISGPWALSDWQEGPAASPARMAVAAHDFIWWGSMVALLNHDGVRLSTFVNPGWIESLLWLDKERLAIAGFNNARNEAMVALLDATSAGGQAPGNAGTAFACVSCASTPPRFYSTLPRSELNQVTGQPFNRAQVDRIANQFVVTTIEMEDGSATAMYEFDGGFRFLRARYSESYWDAHRRLELEGRLTHSRETCPERNGPPAIHVWAAQGGWIKTPPAGRN